jgi:N utilization substance protein B
MSGEKVAMTGTRRKARIIAFQALYEVDTSGHRPETVIHHVAESGALSEENLDFTTYLVNGTLAHKEEIDGNIRRFAPAWPLEQIPAVDRNILRLAIFEIIFGQETPLKVAINEAVELAKRFGSESSPRFINGVLGSVTTWLASQSMKSE